MGREGEWAKFCGEVVGNFKRKSGRQKEGYLFNEVNIIVFSKIVA